MKSHNKFHEDIFIAKDLSTGENLRFSGIEI